MRTVNRSLDELSLAPSLLFINELAGSLAAREGLAEAGSALGRTPHGDVVRRRHHRRTLSRRCPLGNGTPALRQGE